MLKIVTFNCQKAFQPTFEPFMKEILSEKRYDFLLLQEATQEVIEIIRPFYKEFGYTRLSALSPKTGTELLTCILYKNEFEFLRSDFITFTPNVMQEVTETGSVSGIFKTPRRLLRTIKKKKILVIATHLHASYHMVARKKELAQVKTQAMYLNPDNECFTIIAGDLNNLMPGEHKSNDIFMKPEFKNVSDFPEHTYDTNYLEPKYSKFFLAKVFFVGGKTYKKKLDHMYMDSESAAKLTYKCKVIEVVASDHRPVEVMVYKKSRLNFRKNADLVSGL